MNRNYLLFGLIAVIFIMAQSRANDQSVAQVIKAQRIELVDEHGKIRASLKYEEGETIFRLMDADGTIRVKLGGGRDGSGLVLLNDSTEVGIQALAKSNEAFLKIEEDGKKVTIEP